MKWQSFIEEAAANPSRFYARPMDVVRDRRLSNGERLAILDSWERDSRALAVAEEESMTGGEGDLLGEVVKARIAAGDPDKLKPDLDGPAAPTKHGG